MKKILISLMVIGVVAVMTGGGVFSTFSDTETSSANTFTAGTLNLLLSNQDEATTPAYTDGVSATWTASNIKPGDTGVDTLLIKNAGSIDGYIDLSDISVDDAENGCNEPEQNAGDTTTGGEMSAKLKTQLWIDSDGDEVVGTDGIIGGNKLTEESVYPAAAIGKANPGKAPMNGISGSYNLDELLGSGSVENLAMAWELPPGTGNIVQTDKATLVMTVELDQTKD